MEILALRKIACFAIAAMCIIPAAQVKSQDIDVDLSADVVSSYVWRGAKSAGASIQPSLTASAGAFSLGAWASTDIAGAGAKEVDFTAAYQAGGFKVAVTDYWWDGEEKYRYFSSPLGDNNGHYVEGTIGYTLPEAFPLSVSWNTFFLGKGNKKGDGDNSYSTFVELAYPFSVKGVDMGISAGFTPWESAVYGTDGFKFTSIALSATKSIKFSDSFSLPIFGNIICNPNQEDIHFVFGFKIQ